MRIRYIKLASNGSNKNAGNHYAEVEAVDVDGVNRALGRGLYTYSYMNTTAGKPSVVTDGDRSYTKYFDNGEGSQWIVIDLGAVFNIAEIRIWRYYTDGRIYKNCVISVSLDNAEYTAVFDSSVDGEYKETASGYTISLPVQSLKYLIRSNSTLYTVTDGALVPLPDAEVSASLFRDYGVDELPDGSLLAGVTDPEVLYWHDSTDDLPTLSLTVTGTPPVPQVVVTDAQDMSDSTILGIESVTVTASDDVLWAISFDDGATWKAHNGSQWVTLEQENSGMTAETFQNLSLEAWAEVVTSTAYRLRFVLMTADSYVSEVIVNYIN